MKGDLIVYKSMHYRKYITYFLIIATLLLLVVGCGGNYKDRKTTEENNSENPEPVTANAVTLTWEAPMFNIDGSSFTDLAGYKLYYGTSSRNYTESITVIDASTATIDNLSSGTTYYFAVTAYDTSNNESEPSNEVSITL